MMNQEEHTMLIVKSNLKLLCQNLAYVIIVMHTSLLRVLLLLIILLLLLLQIILIKNCAPFTICISEINNTQVDNAKDIDIVMPMSNLIEYNDNYSKTSGSLW